MKLARLGIFSLCLASGSFGKELNSYPDLPCAEEAEFETLAKRAHVFTKPEGALCDGSRLAKLGKLLKLANELKVEVSPTWVGAEEALASPLSYMESMNRLLGLDFTQGYLAYNRGGAVYLSSTFFEISPLEAVMTLVHESRHSASASPKHEMCLQGDLPFYPKGCDSWFRPDGWGGAYSYQVSWLLGMAKFYKDLSSADRQFCIHSALALFGTRFNRVPETFAVPVDVVGVLDDQGQAFVLHPFTRKLTQIPFPKGTDKIARIEYATGTDGFNFFSATGRPYRWRLGRALAIQLQTPAGRGVIDMGKWHDGASTRLYYLNEQNELQFFQRNRATGLTVPYLSSIELGFIGHRFVEGGPEAKRYMLAKDGVLYGWEKTGFVPSLFQAQGGWAHTTSGMLFAPIFGISQEGELFYKNDKIIEKSWFQAAGAKKYVEGTNLRILLTGEGKLNVHRVGTGENAPFAFHSDHKIVDVAVSRDILSQDRSLDRNLDPFAKTCDLKTWMVDPWAKQGMGINTAGQLVFKGDATEPCLIYPAAEKWTSLEIAGSEVLAEGKGHRYPVVHLRLKSETGKITELFPYRG